MGTLAKWFWGFIILTIIGLLVNLFAPSPFGAKANSVNMGKSVERALNDAGFGWAKTEMSGNVARIIGDAPSEQAKQAAIEVAQNAQCDKCNKREAGKRWHVVDGDGINIKKLIPLQSPYTLSGVCTNDGGVRLNGYLRSDEELSAFLKNANSLFGGKVVNNKLSVARGAPNANWLALANANMESLTKLQDCSFAMKDGSSMIEGIAQNEADRAAILSSIKSAGAGMNANADIRLLIKDKDKCQALFDEVKGAKKINFAYNRADIKDAESRALLDALARAARQCKSFNIVVEGHTDSSGRASYNKDLSQRRANTVRDYLVANGVDSAQITAIGYGESRPIAKNNTAQGMAANRRIEFNVTNSKQGE